MTTELNFFVMPKGWKELEMVFLCQFVIAVWLIFLVDSILLASFTFHFITEKNLYVSWYLSKMASLKTKQIIFLKLWYVCIKCLLRKPLFPSVYFVIFLQHQAICNFKVCREECLFLKEGFLAFLKLLTWKYNKWISLKNNKTLNSKYHWLFFFNILNW